MTDALRKDGLDSAVQGEEPDSVNYIHDLVAQDGDQDVPAAASTDPGPRRKKYTWNRKCVDPKRVLLVGVWEDIGEGACQRCSTVRRLYTPAVRPDLAVCSRCSQIYANRSMPDTSGVLDPLARDVDYENRVDEVGSDRGGTVDADVDDSTNIDDDVF